MDRSVTVSVRGLVLAGVVGLALVAAYLVGRSGPAPAAAAAADTTRTVTVTGTGQVSVVPDQLAFDLGVSVVREDLDQALSDGNAAMQSVVDALEAAGVDEKDVRTTDLSVYPEYERQQRGRPQVLRGYRVSHGVGVTLDDPARGGAVVTAALDAGGTGVRLDGLRFQVSDPEASLDPARGDALDDARAEAGAYAEHEGLKVGQVVKVSETADQPVEQTMGYAASDSSAAPMPLQAGAQDLTASVTVVYELT